jgi:phosphoribosylformylglycinamidine cyclo-ligase
MFDVAAAGFKDPILVAATDGVGTKLKIAVSANDHSSVGTDLVAMCVNDLVVQGAEPLFFLDYFATAKLIPSRAEQVIRGIANGCKLAGCALIGGETAEMPGMYQGDDYDLAGFSVGAVERNNVLTGEKIVAGDFVLGLRSNGIHSNGFSLVRSVIDNLGLKYEDKAPFSDYPLGATLLTPTRIYVKSCLSAHNAGLIKGLAHITGGGLIENIPRILPEGLSVQLDGRSWKISDVFKWLSRAGGIKPQEMARTFNCGIGMIAIIAPELLEEAIKIFSEAGETVYRIGLVRNADQKEPVEIIDWEEVWEG